MHASVEHQWCTQPDPWWRIHKQQNKIPNGRKQNCLSKMKPEANASGKVREPSTVTQWWTTMHFPPITTKYPNGVLRPNSWAYKSIGRERTTASLSRQNHPSPPHRGDSRRYPGQGVQCNRPSARPHITTLTTTPACSSQAPSPQLASQLQRSQHCCWPRMRPVAPNWTSIRNTHMRAHETRNASSMENATPITTHTHTSPCALTRLCLIHFHTHGWVNGHHNYYICWSLRTIGTIKMEKYTPREQFDK